MVSAGSGGVRVIRQGGKGGNVEVLPGLGVALQEADQAVSVATILPLPNLPESPFTEGDVIVSFGGKEIESLAQLMEIFKGFEIGSTIAVTVKRGDSRRNLELVNKVPPEGLMIRKPH
jgi:S1-C subfamily serine protease